MDDQESRRQKYYRDLRRARLHAESRVYERGAARRLAKRQRQVRNTYGLSAAEINAMRRKQRNACAICDNEFTDRHRENIDHCHATDCVRGLLCRGCNCGLGHFLDSPWLLLRAFMYLREHGRPVEPPPPRFVIDGLRTMMRAIEDNRAPAQGDLFATDEEKWEPLDPSKREELLSALTELGEELDRFRLGRKKGGNDEPG